MTNVQTFDFEKTLKLASYVNWPDCNRSQYSPVQLVKSGYSYTGQRMIVKCDDCDVKVDIQNDDVISLSKSHERSCRINDTLRGNVVTNISTLSSGNECLSAMCKTDMTIYPSLLSIKAAPEECSCSKCLVSLVTSECGFRSRDIYGFRRLSGCSLIMNVKKKLSSQNGPEYPDQSDKVNRLNSLRELYEFEEAEDIAEAGFFSGRYGESMLSCFYCGLSLCDNLLIYNPWREHARWCPVCPYLRMEKPEQFIHDVIHDTKMLKRYYKAYDRPNEMNISIVEDALQTFPRIIIEESIQSFFQEFGSFPKADELFHILKQKKEHKTFETIPRSCV